MTHTVGRFAALPCSSGRSFLYFKNSVVECPFVMYRLIKCSAAAAAAVEG